MTGCGGRLGRWWLLAVTAALTAGGCASVEPLDDAQLLDLRLASVQDMARHAQADQQRAREMFGGASFSDGRGTIVASFSADQYDQYLAYLQTRPDANRTLVPLTTTKWPWPTLYLSFRSRRMLFDPRGSSMPQAIFYRCNTKEDQKLDLAGFGMHDVMWRGHFVTKKEIASQIDAELKAQIENQTYEVLFPYVFWEGMGTRTVKAGDPTTLLPLPDDLCISLHEWNYPFPSTVGRPLKIRRDVVNEAVGKLPRTLNAKTE